MPDDTTDRSDESRYDRILGLPFGSIAERRDKLAEEFGEDFGADRFFPAAIDALLDEIPEGSGVLEVGAATGYVTRRLLERAGSVTALEISEKMLHTIAASDTGFSPNLSLMHGVVEDLPREVGFDIAVVTFTPRRGTTLVRLLVEMAYRVADRIVMLFEDDPSMDWAYLARAAAGQGFDVRLRMLAGPDRRRAVLLTVSVRDWTPTFSTEDEWVLDAREVYVPYPAPRGTAARLIRYFLTIGDRALLIRTEDEGAERLYGNLRTAAHRLGRGEVTVRFDAESISLVRLPGNIAATPPSDRPDV